ncbi:hypothetical protein JR338_10505 [Chloroflexota bacterium]|nr:hypothetical protein JR338_10505 [Chloroflexota bacterium]
MTLIFNEIIIQNGLANSFMIAAADRRITLPDGSHRNWRKLFNIPYLHGAVSYYGIAEIPKKGNRNNIPFSSWLPNFIRDNAGVESIRSFSFNLFDEINRLVPSSLIQRYASGFHICGYDNLRYPDFWSIKNYHKYENFIHQDIEATYKTPVNDLRTGDLHNIDWEGNSQSSVNAHVIYRNGDIRAHGIIFSEVGKIYNNLSNFTDFNKIKTPQDYKDFAKLKFEILSYIYNKMTKKKIIGGTIDVLLLERP